VYEGLTILQPLSRRIYYPPPVLRYKAGKVERQLRLCVVELEDENGTRDVKACQTPIKEGMVLTTNSPT
jgi:formate dehydrogenase major subunit